MAIHPFKQCLPVPRRTNKTFVFDENSVGKHGAWTLMYICAYTMWRKTAYGFRCSVKCLAIELARDIYKKIHLATYEIIWMHQHALHTNAPISSVLGNYRSKAVTAISDRSRRASNVTRSRLSFVTIATDNDVCVRRFVKFARQKSFSG